MPSETIADILSEIVVQKYQTSFSAADVIAWRDRIEAAAKRDEREADCTNCDYANVVAENERLRAALDEICKTKDEMIRQRCEQVNRLNAALAPVLACKTLSAEGSMPNYSGCLEAVREAQRIAREGEANNEAR